MNFNILNDFRHGLYDCFKRSKDTLFEITDALLTETQATSPIELTLSPFFTRHWFSFYKALEHGIIDRPALRKLLIRFIPTTPLDQPLLVGLDACNIPRPESPTARDRTP